MIIWSGLGIPMFLHKSKSQLLDDNNLVIILSKLEQVF